MIMFKTCRHRRKIIGSVVVFFSEIIKSSAITCVTKIKLLGNFITMSGAGPPKVWSKFTVTSKAGKIYNLRMLQMPDNLYEVVAELYIKYFVPEEPTFKASGISKSAEAMEELREKLIEGVKTFHTVICCLDNGDDTIHNNNIIGASLMALTTKGEPEIDYQLKSEELKKLYEIFIGMMDLYDEAKEFNLDPYFSDKGLFVNVDYRGLGIAQELLKVRRMICKEHGVPINGAWMTSYGTQKAAQRDGWETVAEINSEELGKKFNVIFEKEPPTCKFMIARINC